MLLILKIILFLILFLLLIFAGVLFIPFKTVLTAGNRQGSLALRSKVYWISWLLAVKIYFIDKKLTLFIQVFGIPVKIPLKLKKKKPAADKTASKPLKASLSEKMGNDKQRQGNIPESGKEEKKTFRITDMKSTYEEYKPFIREIVLPQLKYLLHYFHIRVKKLDLTVAGEDPSFVGIAQGAVSAIVPFVGKVKYLEPVSVRFDYVGKTAEFYADLYFSMNLYGIVIRLFIIWWHYRKMSRAQIRISHESDPGKTA